MRLSRDRKQMQLVKDDDEQMNDKSGGDAYCQRRTVTLTGDHTVMQYPNAGIPSLGTPAQGNKHEGAA